MTLTIRGIDRLNSIKNQLLELKQLNTNDQIFLAEFLSQIPSTNMFLSVKTPFEEYISVSLWKSSEIDEQLKKWQNLFSNIPGWDYCPFCFIVDNETPELLQKNVIMAVRFAPSYAYNLTRSDKDRAYEIWLKDDGTALFQLPTLEDAEKHLDLYNFKGSWKEAYLLLIETLKKGWPMEEFPEELKPFLKK